VLVAERRQEALQRAGLSAEEPFDDDEADAGDPLDRLEEELSLSEREARTARRHRRMLRRLVDYDLEPVWTASELRINELMESSTRLDTSDHTKSPFVVDDAVRDLVLSLNSLD
jgi:hypothetical protein